MLHTIAMVHRASCTPTHMSLLLGGDIGYRIRYSREKVEVMAEKKMCPLCNEPLEDPPRVHIQSFCERTERLKGRVEIQKLKASIAFWKDAWFAQRDATGRSYWQGFENGIEDVPSWSYCRGKPKQEKKQGCGTSYELRNGKLYVVPLMIQPDPFKETK
jgi:hypothetical protein